MSEQEKSWKVKAKRFVLGLVVFLLFIWAISTANKAKGLAQENEQKLTTPDYQMSFVLGGPERLADAYDSVDNADTEKLNAKEFVWATFIIKNTSSGTATDVEINLNNTVPADKILVTASGWDNEVSIEEGENPTNSIVSVEEITPEEPTYLFIGLNKNEVPDNLTEWSENYTELISSVKIEADDSSAAYYGKGYNRSL